MEIKHYNIQVTGMVQGVYFRASTQKMANLYSVKGFVKNKEDGSVYIEAEGGEEALSKFIQWCRRGPNSARVDDLKLEEAGLQNFSSFQIKYRS